MEREKEKVVCKKDETAPQKGQSTKEKKMNEHLETRKKIRSIADIASFNKLLQQSTLSDTDKRILNLHYIQEKDFRFIGDMLGYSESTIKKRHKKILSKLSRLL